MTRQHVCLITVLLSLAACSEPSAPSAAGDTNKSESKSKDEPGTGTGSATPAQPGNGRFTGEGIVDLGKLLHRTPEQVEAVLGKPSDTGMQRISCVRFVPERVFFACEQEARFYPFAKLERIEVEYEDGHAAAINLVGLPGEGAFDPYAALKVAGLELPGEPKPSSPATMGDSGDKVEVWDWGNDKARLLVGKRQYRVRLSVVNGDWKRSKLEVVDNSPLSDDEKQRIKQPKNQAPAEGGAEAGESALVSEQPT